MVSPTSARGSKESRASAGSELQFQPSRATQAWRITILPLQRACRKFLAVEAQLARDLLDLKRQVHQITLALDEERNRVATLKLNHRHSQRCEIRHCFTINFMNHIADLEID